MAEVLAASGGFDPFSSPLTANGGRNLVSAGIGQALNRAGAGAALETALIKLGSTPAVKRATALLDIAVNLGARPMPKGVTAVATSSAIKNFQSKLGKEIFTPSDLVGGGVGLVVDVGYQLWMDWDNPYLTTGQIGGRLGVAGFASVTSFGIGTIAGYYGGAALGSIVPVPVAGTIIGIVVGVGVGVILDFTLVPLIYQGLGLNPQRNLARLE